VNNNQQMEEMLEHGCSANLEQSDWYSCIVDDPLNNCLQILNIIIEYK